MRRSWWSFLLLLVLASAPAIAQYADTDFYPLPASEENQRLIDRLKETPVNQIEPALPGESFDSWCSRLVKPKRIEYEVSESRERTGSVYRSTLWVIAYTQPSQSDGRRWVQVRFVVVDLKPSKDANNRGEPRPFALRLYDALELPAIEPPPSQIPGSSILADLQVKPSYDRFSKLSALEKSVQRSQGKETPRKTPL
jgi:hypothetical protein